MQTYFIVLVSIFLFSLATLVANRFNYSVNYWFCQISIPIIFIAFGIVYGVIVFLPILIGIPFVLSGMMTLSSYVLAGLVQIAFLIFFSMFTIIEAVRRP